MKVKLPRWTSSLRSGAKRRNEFVAVSTPSVENRDVHFVGPLPDKHGKIGGVGLYNLRFAQAFAASASESAKIWIHAQTTYDPAQVPRNSRITAVPAWRLGALSALDLLRLFDRSPGVVMFHYEVSLYGSILTSLLLAPLISLLRLNGWTVHVLLHHVILPGFSSKTIRDWKSPSPIDYVALAILRLNQRLIACCANDVIVHEPIQATVLLGQHVTIIPHGVTLRERPSSNCIGHLQQNDRPLKIGVFGFIAPYKGVYETVQAVSDLLKFGERIELNIIGGIHPRMATARTYKEFLRTLQGLIAQHPEMHMHGYVPSDRLDSLLLANDLMLLPYRSTIGSSGALSYALGLGLPVAVSDYLATFMTLPAGVPTFEPTRESIGRFLSRVLVDRRLPELGPLAELAAERSWESVGRRYRALVLATDPD